MGELMTLKVIFLRGAVGTMRAGKGFFPGVHSDVLFQMIFPSSGVDTVGASVPLLGGILSTFPLTHAAQSHLWRYRAYYFFSELVKRLQ